MICRPVAGIRRAAAVQRLRTPTWGSNPLLPPVPTMTQQQQVSQHISPRQDIRYAFICMVATILCGLATFPVLEAGVGDDFAYSYMAQLLAETGRFEFNGWETAMVGPQIWWGAALIKLFGFSHTLIRFSVLLLAAGCAGLLYWLGRRTPLPPAPAALLALTVALSPVFLPVALSYQTDVPGFFFLLLSLSCCVRAVEEEKHGSAVLWLAATVLTGLVGGAIRQIVWFVPLFALPYAVYLRGLRHGPAARRPALLAAIPLWLLTVISVGLCDAWYKRQPFSVPDPVSSYIQNARSAPWHVLPSNFIMAELTLILLLLPVLLPLVPTLLERCKTRVRVAPQENTLLMGGAALFALAQVGLLMRVGRVLPDFLPYWWGILEGGGMHGWSLVGAKEIPLPLPLRALVFFLVVAVLMLLYIEAAFVARQYLHRSSTASPQDEVKNVSGMVSTPIALFACFVAIYGPLILFRTYAPLSGIIGRYLTPFLPLLGLLALRRLVADRGRVPTIGWITLGFVATYSVAVMQTHFAMSRARLEALRGLTLLGVPRTEIMAGVDFDGWEELEQTGHLNVERVTNPPNAFRRVTYTPPVSNVFYELTPSITPRYFLVTVPDQKLKQAGSAPPIPFTSLLPPFRNFVYVLEAPERLGADASGATPSDGAQGQR